MDSAGLFEFDFMYVVLKIVSGYVPIDVWLVKKHVLKISTECSFVEFTQPDNKRVIL